MVEALAVVFLGATAFGLALQLWLERRRWDRDRIRLEGMVSARSHREFVLYEKLNEQEKRKPAKPALTNKEREEYEQRLEASVGNPARFRAFRRGGVA